MDYTIRIEGVEMNHIKISSEIAPSRFYDMDKWTLGAAVENYIESEIAGEQPVISSPRGRSSSARFSLYHSRHQFVKQKDQKFCTNFLSRNCATCTKITFVQNAQKTHHFKVIFVLAILYRCGIIISVKGARELLKKLFHKVEKSA